MSDPIVIVGAGLAAYHCAREFRKLDTETPLFIVARDGAGFYSKPMLSNALAAGKSPEALVMKSAEKMAEELNATIWPRCDMASFDPSVRTVSMADGRQLRYRDLVLALGADPIRLPLTSEAAQQVLSVNDLDDYARFAGQLPAEGVVAILGSGLIGCEFANDLLARGLRPVLIDPAAWPLSRLVPREAGDWLRRRLEAAGVSFRLGVAAQAVETADDGYRIVLVDGEVIQAALVLSAVGLAPRVALARAAGLDVARGIVVGRDLQTSAPHVWALGDCAEVAGMSLPFVMPIMQQARALAATLAGQAASVGYPAMPVIVKTPACPTVVAPCWRDSDCTWQIEADDGALVARRLSGEGVLEGFVLMGEGVKQRQALVPQLLPWLD
ncbi:pyridine nucleotide-disulfide oxidoreductase [Chitiniphilus shinanonensis]|uniref:Pyridine nucleotide-disulfide oxidoreductase n=1 Tax=Chitiniphilus shinanonensis TaxID=553088 RepID=A0ABQ6BTC9_9NEIS|nr:FAD-dependent oxidoreductase [Chitiniphilus shinanonensis]GLS04759.1 pyridine nucleotide-disulfide oxidoreductase [Chitiniphilus shinanonensis]